MSNEQNGPGTDPLVSETYRELAGEKTPEALNREILQLAAREGRTPFAVSRAWTRPLAWAATIALSLTLVLHLTDTPQPTSVPLEPATDEDAATADFAARQDVGGRETPASQPVTPDSVETVQIEASRVATPAESEPSVAKRSRAEMQQRAAKIEIANDRPVAAVESPAAPVESPVAAAESPAAETDDAAPAANAFAPTDLRDHAEESGLDEALAEAETVSKARHTEQRLAERPAAGVAAMSSMAVTADASGEEPLCPPEARETLQQWLECIAEFEATVPPELVEREYEALQVRFPEFEHPAQ